MIAHAESSPDVVTANILYCSPQRGLGCDLRLSRGSESNVRNNVVLFVPSNWHVVIGRSSDKFQHGNGN